MGSHNFIGIDWIGYTWNNKDGDRWHNNDYKSGTSNSGIESTIHYFTIGNSGDKNIIERIYSNTNWMKCYGSLEYQWENDFKLVIKCKVEVRVYASGLNAYWAKASSQLEIKNIIFA